MLDLEFTVEQGRLWMLQARVGKRTGVAALRMAVEMTTDAHIRLSRAEAVRRITPEHLEQVLHPRLAASELPVLTTGLGASPGAAVGSVVFTTSDAVARAASGETHPALASIPSDRPVIGVVVTLEPFHLINSDLVYGDVLDRPSIPTVVASSHELEGLVSKLRGTTNPGQLLLDGLSPDSSDLRLDRIGTDLPDERNPLLQEAWDRFSQPWTNLRTAGVR